MDSVRFLFYFIDTSEHNQVIIFFTSIYYIFLQKSKYEFVFKLSKVTSKKVELLTLYFFAITPAVHFILLPLLLLQLL